jgi:hypothetical protein
MTKVHGLQTIVITNSEQAERFMEHLENCKAAAKVDDYASERKRPIKWMTCTCCGNDYQGRQWWNQDHGYGLGDCCVEFCGVRPDGGESGSYGVPGIHFLISKEERDNPPIVEDRGVPLYGIDTRLRIEYDGYVYWKGLQIEHYSGTALHGTEENKEQARELIRRCELLESRGTEVTTTSVIWNWNE